MSPDWDAIGSVWLLKKYLSGWQDAKIQFVPAGQRLPSSKFKVQSSKPEENPIEIIGENEVIHVDTGLAPLDHHQTQDVNVSAVSLVWDYVQNQFEKTGNKLTPEHIKAITRIVKIIVDTDHFKEVFWKDADADYHEFSLLGLLEGLKLQKPGKDMEYLNFGMDCLEALIHTFENRIWAEEEIKKGHEFKTRFGKGMGFDTLNDTVLKLAQKMGYVLVVRKDPRKGYVRIKTLPATEKEKGIDLTLAYEQLKKIDPDATWFLHVSKKMLLNGTPKNPKMRPTKLSLSDIIKVLEKL
jgi:hypothetical protein